MLKALKDTATKCTPCIILNKTVVPEKKIVVFSRKKLHLTYELIIF